MKVLLGIRREDKNKWEKRTPLIPEHVKELKQKESINIVIQSSKIRAFSDEDYVRAGAKIQDSLDSCEVILAIKEIPIRLLEQNKTYAFFSHTIKGQPHNMPMLKRIMELSGTLIDYERIVDSKGKRLILFGRWAGIAGAVDTLWALGKRLELENIPNPFSELKQSWRYKNLAKAKDAVVKIGNKINSEGIDRSIVPLVIGIAGYGNVSKGVQEILQYLPIIDLDPKDLSALLKSGTKTKNNIYKVVFEEKHTVEAIGSGKFELQDYYKNPEKYRSKFHIYLPYLTVLINAIYWEKRYPRLVTKEALRKLYGSEGKTRLRVIGDISCDLNGAIECTASATDIDNPLFVYNPLNDTITDGYGGEGVVVMAIDNLPCELPIESSTDFSQALKKFVPWLAKADFSGEFKKCKLPREIKDAIIVYRGELTPNYKYLEKFLEGVGNE